MHAINLKKVLNPILNRIQYLFLKFTILLIIEVKIDIEFYQINVSIHIKYESQCIYIL